MAVPAGWYDDGTGRQRWWDGDVWGVYAQDVSSAQLEVSSGGYGQATLPVGPSAKSPGMLGKLGRAVKNTALEQRAAAERRRREREEREQEARRRQEELDRQAGALVTSGVFGTANIEIFENGYVRIDGVYGDMPVRSQAIQGSASTMSWSSKVIEGLTFQGSSVPPYERLVSIAFSRGGKPSSSEPMSGAVNSATVRTAIALAKGGSSVLKASAPGAAIAGVGYLAKAVSGKSVLTIATDQQIYTLTNQVKNSTGIPLVKRDQEGVGEVLERAGNSVLTALGRGPVAESAPALPSGQVEVPQGLSSPSMSSADVTANLRELAKLHDDGILDDADFLIAKRQLLGKL